MQSPEELKNWEAAQQATLPYKDTLLGAIATFKKQTDNPVTKSTLFQYGDAVMEVFSKVNRECGLEPDIACCLQENGLDIQKEYEKLQYIRYSSFDADNPAVREARKVLQQLFVSLKILCNGGSIARSMPERLVLGDLVLKLLCNVRILPNSHTETKQAVRESER